MATNSPDQFTAQSNFAVVTTTTGAISIRDNTTGETMHNPVGPWLEANSLYIEQSNLTQRLREPSVDPLVIFDVGLGAAANALAALHCARKTQRRRPLRVVSFEQNLELLHFALLHADQFAHFQGFEVVIRSLLENGQWQDDEGIDWQLRHGDYLEKITIEAERAHLVFYDPYSMTKNPEMWSAEAFTNTYRKCRNSGSEGAHLYTYSRATPVRVALLLAGFYIGQGVATGLKPETSQAATRLQDLEQPMGEAWLQRWQRSDKKFPPGSPSTIAPEEVLQRIPLHPQFVGTTLVRRTEMEETTS